jgi:hypothetical protein
MFDSPAGTRRAPQDRVQIRAPRGSRPASELLYNGSVKNKAVRFGSWIRRVSPLAKQGILSLVVVLMLAVCVLSSGQVLSLEFSAFGLVAFLIAAQVFSPLDLAYRQSIGRTYKVRPGITGWAQVNGFRGEASTVDAMHHRVQYDLDYLKNRSLWLDLKMVARTALTVVNDHNAYWQENTEAPASRENNVAIGHYSVRVSRSSNKIRSTRSHVLND